MIRRLGGFPFWRGARPFLDALQPVYSSASSKGIEIFLAKKLSLGKQKLDSGEFLETLIVPFDEAIAMIRDGRITDAKTVAALLLVKEPV